MTTIFYALVALVLGINTPVIPQDNSSEQRTIDAGVGLIQMDSNEDFLVHTIDAGVLRLV